MYYKELEGKPYVYPCFITDLSKYALLDDDKCMRGTSPDLGGIVRLKQFFGWGTIIRIKFHDNGITFGEIIE